MPTKIKVDSCAELVLKMSRASAFNDASSARTSALSPGIKGASKHLEDMWAAGLIERKRGRIKHFFVDESNAPKIFVPFDQIDAVRERSVREMMRLAADKTQVGKVILDFLSIKKVEEIYDKLYEEDKLFNETVDMLKLKRLLDRQYRFNKIGWRNSSYRWYLGASIMSLI